MRWLKHMTATRQDEKIAAYLDSCKAKDRHEAYGIYWAILEIVASGMEKESMLCSATYSLTSWSHLLYSHHHTVGKYIGKLQVTGLVTVTKDEDKITVEVPNLLKYRDEYSKKSGHSTDNVRPKIEKEIQKQIQKQIQNTEYLKPMQQKPLRVVPEKTGPSQEDLLIAKYAPAIHKRHVARKCSLKIVCEKLKAILVKTREADRVAVIETIDSNHEQHCISDNWTKEGGQYCPGLEKWLSPKHERYLTPPDREVAHQPFQNGIVADTMRYLNEH